MKMAAFHFTAQQQETRFLWFRYASSSTQIFTANQAMTLNEREYAKNRKKIQEKLGQKVVEYIDDLELA